MPAFRVFAVLAAIASLAPAALAQTFIWDGGASHGNFTVNDFWSTPNNWVGGSAPVSGVNTDLAFANSGIRTTATQNVGNPFVLHTITFDAGNTNFTAIFGNPLDFHDNAATSAPLINQNSGVAITIANAINLTDSISIQGIGAGGLTLSGTLSGSGNLTKNGSFALTLGTDNTGYGGSVTIAGGSIVLGNGNALGGSTVAVNVNNGLNLNGQASPTLGALAGSGNIAAGSTATVFTVGGNNASTTYSGALTGSATDFAMAGTGTLTLTGKGSSVHGLDVNNGSVVLDGGATFAATSSAGVNGPRRAIEVGNSSNASSLIVQGGSTLDTSAAQEATVGLSSVAQTMTVQGAGTLWKLPAQTDIGGDGTGTLAIQSGAKATGGTFLDLGNAGTGTIQILSGGQVTTNSVFAAINGSGLLTIGGANSSLNANAVFLAYYGASDTGTLKVTAGGAAKANVLQIDSLSSSVTVDGGTLSADTITEVSGYTAPIAISDPAGGGTALTVGSSNGSSTIVTPITDATSGPGTVVKAGTGALTLTGHLTNTGGYNATNGTIDFSGATVEPQFGSLTAAAGATIKYDNGARVFGGYLDGPGTHSLNGATLNGSTVGVGAVVTQAGPATVVNLTNNGSFTNPAGQTLTWTNGTNTSGGSLTVSGTVNASGMINNGVATINPGGKLAITGSSSLVLGGGSRTYLGTAAAQGGTITAPAGVTIELNGGLLDNNGTVGSNGAGKVNINYGGLAMGAGNYAGGYSVNQGGTFSPGNSPGTLTSGAASWGAGGTYRWEMDAANGAAGTGWDLNQINGSLTIAAGTSTNGKFTVALETLTSTDSVGPADHFDPTQHYQWPIAEASGGITGFSTSEFNLDTSGFANPTDGGTFALSLSPDDQTLSVTFTPVPEPSALVLAGLTMVGLSQTARRRRYRDPASGA